MAHTIRLASYEDALTLIELMRELAVFEKMEASFKPSLENMQKFLRNTEEYTHNRLSEDFRLLHAWIAEDDDGHAVGFAMGFYGGFSSFATSWEFCLHDLYVHPEVRRSGLAQQFFQHIADAVFRYTDTISFEVLDWNEGAIALYERLSATDDNAILRDGENWIPMKIQGEAFTALQNARANAAQNERW